VTVVGTVFDVAANASSMTLDVTEGAVILNNTMNHQITVRAGEQAIAGKDNPRIRRTITLAATDSRLIETINNLSSSICNRLLRRKLRARVLR
jgi:ferric-dicitrate binding protein FerR (iron transport regulator)